MKNLLVILSVFVLGLAAFGCGGVEEEPIDEQPTFEGKADFPGPDCTYKCNVCPPNAKRCSLICTWVGNCNTQCATFEECSDGFAWFPPACRCLPDVTP